MVLDREDMITSHIDFYLGAIDDLAEDRVALNKEIMRLENDVPAVEAFDDFTAVRKKLAAIDAQISVYYARVSKLYADKADSDWPEFLP